MRVISGSARGTKLTTVSGTDLVRPTSDKVKGAIFNMLQWVIPDAEVLDLFCGSGALGIEALSRGAAHAVFLDASPRSLAVTGQNLQRTHLDRNAHCVRSDWKQYLSRKIGTYNIVFADPPYAMHLLEELLSLCEGVLAENGFLVFECSAGTVPFVHPSFSLYRQACYGKTAVLIYQRSTDRKEAQANEDCDLSRQL